MLAGGDGDGDGADQLAEDHRTAIEDSLRKRVKDMVEGVVGPGNARVTVSADVDMNRVTLQEEKFDPDGQVVRSTQTSEQNAKSGQTQSAAGASAAANIPGGQASSGSSDGGTASGQTDETTNYEISKSTRTQVTEPGAIKKLSVAVAVNGQSTYDAKGKVTYTPRTADEMKRIEALVRSAIGFDQARGDQLTVVNVRFTHDEDAQGVTAGSPLLGFDKNDIMRGVELVMLLITADPADLLRGPAAAEVRQRPGRADAGLRRSARPDRPRLTGGAGGAPAPDRGPGGEHLALPSARRGQGTAPSTSPGSRAR